jgi:hypothetical protein
MATYKLLSHWVNDTDPETHWTKVEFTFDNSSKVTVDIPHFRPASLAELDASIKTRGAAEWDRKVAVAAAVQAGTALDPYINQNRPFNQT